MSWWRRLLGLNSQPEETEASGSGEGASAGPELILLMPEAASLAALRTISFEDAKSAAEYIEFWYPRRSNGELHPFWALAGEPSEEWSSDTGERGESLVLIRDEVRENIVYPFSFTDMPTALMFVRQEVNSGIAFDRICVHWAITVAVSYSESGRVTLSPGTPPPLAKNTAFPEMRGFSVDTKTKFVRSDDRGTAKPPANGNRAEIDQWVPRFPVLSQRIESLVQRETPVEGIDEQQNIAPVTPMRTNGTPMAMTQNGTTNSSSDGHSIDEHPDIEDDHEEKTPDIGSDDVPGDIGKIQRWRRLERHDGPFKGFDSPRDRF